VNYYYDLDYFFHFSFQIFKLGELKNADGQFRLVYEQISKSRDPFKKKYLHAYYIGIVSVVPFRHN
jgi:hypothetical protein